MYWELEECDKLFYQNWLEHEDQIIPAENIEKNH